MKILFVAAGSFRQNASFIRAAALGGQLQLQGHDPVFCLKEAPDTRALLEQHGVSEKCSWARTRSPIDFLRLARRFTDVDFVHLINANLAGEILGLRLRPGGARVISDWDEWLSRVPFQTGFHQRTYALEFIARRISSAFIFSSSYLQSEYRRYLGKIPTAYIPYGLNPSGPVTPGAATRWLREGRRYAMYLGSLHEMYREDLRELLLLAQSCRDLDLDLVVAGDGSERPWLEAELAKILPSNRIVFTGQLSIPELDGLVAEDAVRLCFLPLKDTMQNRSRCPNKLFHYIKGGKPVVTNRVGEPANLLGELGHYYAYGDAASVTVAVRASLERPPRYDVDSFSWARRASTYVRFLEDNFGPAASGAPGVRRASAA